MRTAFALALALAATAALAPGRAAAGLYTFSYTDSGGGVLAGTIDGTVDPGNSDLVTVTAVTEVTFNGVAAPATPNVFSASFIYGSISTPAVVSFSGSTMDILVINNSFTKGFTFIPANLSGPVNSPVPLFAGSSGFASSGATQSYVAANWSLTPQAAAVPEPATMGMMLLGCGSAGAVVRRFRRRAAA